MAVVRGHVVRWFEVLRKWNRRRLFHLRESKKEKSVREFFSFPLHPNSPASTVLTVTICLPKARSVTFLALETVAES
jgi:hypothetical protein